MHAECPPISYSMKKFSFRDFLLLSGKNDFFSPSIKRDLRFLIDFFRGSLILKMKIGNSLCAYCLLVKGGGRNTFSNKKDYVIEPYVVGRSFRSNGYGNLIVNHLVLHSKNIKNKIIYAVVNSTNTKSLKIMEKNGFIHIGYLSRKRFKYKKVEKKTNFELFMFQPTL